MLASRTFNILPRKGKTPNKSGLTTARPANASSEAESPSVKIRVHLYPSLVPALLASVSLELFMRWRRFPSDFDKTLSAFCCAKWMMLVTASVFAIALRNFSVTCGLLPNALGLVVNCSLVCEVKAGLTIRQFTNRKMWFLIWAFFSFTPPLFFFMTISSSLSII